MRTLSGRSTVAVFCSVFLCAYSKRISDSCISGIRSAVTEVVNQECDSQALRDSLECKWTGWEIRFEEMLCISQYERTKELSVSLASYLQCCCLCNSVLNHCICFRYFTQRSPRMKRKVYSLSSVIQHLLWLERLKLHVRVSTVARM